MGSASSHVFFFPRHEPVSGRPQHVITILCHALRRARTLTLRRTPIPHRSASHSLIGVHVARLRARPRLIARATSPDRSRVLAQSIARARARSNLSLSACSTITTHSLSSFSSAFPPSLPFFCFSLFISSIRRSGAASALFPAASSNLMAAGSAPAVSQARVGVSARAFLHYLCVETVRDCELK